MAQEFAGYDYHEFVEANFPAGVPMTSGSVACGSGSFYGIPYLSPDLVVRVMRNPADGHYHLFVINKHTTSSFTLPGWGGWTVARWKQLSAPSLDAMNPIGFGGVCDPIASTGPDSIYIVDLSLPRPLTIPPISINHIELTNTQ